MTALIDKYRPANWGEVRFQNKAIIVLGRIAEEGRFDRRAYWLVGPTGIGKTTIARLIATEVADEWSTREIDAADLTPAEIAQAEEDSWYTAIGKGGHAFVINEADRLSAAARGKLKTVLERIRPGTVWIFTTTRKRGYQRDLFGGDHSEASQLMDRCLVVNLDGLYADRAPEIAPWLRNIAQLEGLDGKPMAEYERLWVSMCADPDGSGAECPGSLRAALGAIEAGVML